MSKKHGGYYNIRLSCCQSSRALAKRFRGDSRYRFEASFGSSEVLEALLEVTIEKYRFSDRSGPLYAQCLGPCAQCLGWYAQCLRLYAQCLRLYVQCLAPFVG